VKRKLLIPLLVVAAAGFFWAVGPSVSLSFLLRSPIALLRELASLMWPTSAVDSTGPNASIFRLRRTQLLLESAALNLAGAGARVAPRATTGSTNVLSPTNVLNSPSVLNPPTPPIGSTVQDTLVPIVDQVVSPGTVTDILPTITAPSVPSVPSVTVPDVPSVPSVTVPSVPSTPSVTAPSVPSTPSVSVPSTPTPSPPSGGAPSVGGGGGPSVGGGGIGIKLP